MIKKFDEIEKIIDESTKVRGLGKGEDARLDTSVSAKDIRNILLFCSEYDYFILEEEGRLNSLLREAYGKRGRIAPKISRIDSTVGLIPALESGDIDLLIIFKPGPEEDIVGIARDIRSCKPGLPIALVDNNSEELNRMTAGNDEGYINWIFTWFGDGKIFLNITQFIEDLQNQESDTPIHPRKILVLARYPQYYSYLLSEAYDAVRSHVESVLPTDMPPNLESRYRKRYPQVVMASSFEKAKEVVSEYRDDILCVLADLDGNDNGMEKISESEFIELMEETGDRMAYLLLSRSSEWKSVSDEKGINFIQKGSPNYISRIRTFIRDSLGPDVLEFRSTDGFQLAEAKDLKTFEKAIWTIPDATLAYHAREENLVKWLVSIMEFELAHEFETIISLEESVEESRKAMAGALEQHRRNMNRGAISKYSRRTYGGLTRFSRIGKGSMGGKARGLAFMDKIISTYLEKDLFGNLNISMPRTIVVCSDIFDSFLDDNDLVNEELYDLSDERIAIKFMEADLPPVLLGDLRSFIRETKVPIVVRSSSLLEDALHHPFAGVYSSLLLPNESWETDLRFQELCNAVKYVFASVFFQKARTYMDTTPNTIEEEKMAVIIQELIGQKYGDVFYPTVSGVAKSYDYYPSGRCKSTDGVVNLALGLGKAVVDGSSTFRFCPLHPKVPKYGTIKELLGQSQKKYFAVDLTSYVNIVQRDEDSALVELDLETAEKHGILDQTASTYSVDGRLYPGVGRDGPRVVDFAPMRELGTIPLSNALRMLLQVGEIAIGTSVEIEFAINIFPEVKCRADLYLLQIRSMFSNTTSQKIDVGEYSEGEMLAYTEQALGNGVMENIKDIVFVKPGTFELSKTGSVVPDIRDMNRKLMEDGTPYILIGPGRWGSTDEWLGIPVNWSDIGGAKVIVETPVEERIIDASQGSHFFHNMTSAHIGYLTITPLKKGMIDWKWIDDQPLVEETEYVKHVRMEEPMEVRIDGCDGVGVILKRKSCSEKEGV